MAFGTDAGVYPHGDNAKQFFYMVKFGLTPAQAIRAATSNAADLIGRAKDVGTLEPGKFADVIAVTEDPLQNVRALENVGFVMKGGAVVKDGITGQTAHNTVELKIFGMSLRGRRLYWQWRSGRRPSAERTEST